MALVIAQFALVLVRPVGLAYLSLLIGPIPLSFSGADLIHGMGVGTMSITTIRILGLWMALFMLIGMSLNKAGKYISLYRFHLAFLVFVVISIVWAPSAVYGFRMVAKLSLPLMFMLLVLVSVKDSDQLRRMEIVIVISALINMAIAVALRASVTSSHFTVPGMSAAPFSAHLVVVSMLVLATVICKKQKLALSVLVCLALAVLGAFTRITIGAMFIGSSVVLFLSLRGISRFFLPVAGVIGLPALFLLNDRFRNRMFIHGDEIDLSLVERDPTAALSQIHGSGRFDAWDSALNQFFYDSPLFGSGAGATQHYFYSSSNSALGVIHSEYVRMLSEVGIIGLGLFVLAFTFYFFRMLRIYRQTKRSEYARYPLAACGALVSYLIFFATDNGIDYVLQLGNFVFALVAMSEKAREYSTANSVSVTSTPDRPRVAGRRLLSMRGRGSG